MCEEQYAAKVADLEESSPHFIIDISRVSDLRVNGPKIQPSKPISECQKCIDREQYRNVTDAQAHLHQVHFINQPVLTQELLLWIADLKRLPRYQLCVDAQVLIGTLLDHFVHLRKLKKEISHGVCANNVFDASLYRLPSGLVNAFRRILVLIACVAYTGRVACRRYKKFQVDVPPSGFIDPLYIPYIGILGYGAEGSFESAKDELVLMSSAGDYSRGITYDAVGPEYVMFLLRGDLYKRTQANHAINLLHVYEEYATRLKYQVAQRPRKRLLSKIYAFEEEVRAVYDVMIQQVQQGKYYADILSPDSFRVTTHTRDFMFEQHERMEALMDRFETLATETKQRLEILQEDHSKAILVFTIVTIIFLPLSFVSSFLGMNTVDIRTSGAGQWLFWAIAVPLTTIVVASSVMIGYRSEDFRQFWEETIMPKLRSKRNTDRVTLLDQRRP